jgi:HPt (histidine-containing phosphotransfer) domain-containing protein
MSSIQPDSILNRMELDQFQSIDWEVLERLEQLAKDSGSGILNQMIGLFRKNVPGHLERIREAINDRNPETLRKNLHSLKSATCYVGAIGIARICDQIRACVEGSDFARMEELHKELGTEYERILQILGCS